MMRRMGIPLLYFCVAVVFLLAGKGDADENADSTSINPRLEIRRLLRASDAEYRQGNWDKALAVIDSLMTFDPSNPDGFYLKGKISLAKGDTASALDILTLASQKAPRSERIKLLLARLYLKQGNGEEVLVLTGSILAIKPSDSEASYLQGCGLLLQGDTAQAVEIFERVLDKELDGAGR